MRRLPTIADVLQAEQRIRPHVPQTPIEAAPLLGENTYFKLENLNKTRSFKVRGALNAILALSDEDKARGVVTSSAGNHAQGIAYGAKQINISAKIVMPSGTAKRKVKGVRSYGADIILHGDTYDDAEIHAHKMERNMGMTFVSPYNDPVVIAGQGTLALELFQQLPTLERIIVPVGGGGLISGIGLVAKTLNPDCEVIGVQSTATPAMYNYLNKTGHPETETLAEGLAGDVEKDSITLKMVKTVMDDLILVPEDALKDAIRWTLQHHNWVIEGAAAVTVAALQTEKIPNDGRTTALIICGGNLDYETLRSIIA